MDSTPSDIPLQPDQPGQAGQAGQADQTDLPDHTDHTNQPLALPASKEEVYLRNMSKLILALRRKFILVHHLHRRKYAKAYPVYQRHQKAMEEQRHLYAEAQTKRRAHLSITQKLDIDTKSGYAKCCHALTLYYKSASAERDRQRQLRYLLRLHPTFVVSSRPPKRVHEVALGDDNIPCQSEGLKRRLTHKERPVISKPPPSDKTKTSDDHPRQSSGGGSWEGRSWEDRSWEDRNRSLEVNQRHFDTFSADCIDDNGNEVLPGDAGTIPVYSNVSRMMAGLPMVMGASHSDYFFKTFGLILYHSPYSASVPWNRRVFFSEVTDIYATGQFTITAHTFLYLRFELMLFFAHRGGFSRHTYDDADAAHAIDATQLINFRCDDARWTSVTPDGLRVPSHDPCTYALHIDVEVKSFSGADMSLMQEFGMSVDTIFEVLEPIFREHHHQQSNNASPWREEDGRHSREALDFIAQSTVFAVRVLAAPNLARYRHCICFLGSGGWVAPPPYIRHRLRDRGQQLTWPRQADASNSNSKCNSRREYNSNHILFGYTPKKEASPPRFNFDPAPFDPLADTKPARPCGAHLTAACTQLIRVALPKTMPLGRERTRRVNFTQRLERCLEKQYGQVPSTAVRPRDIYAAADPRAALPRPNPYLYPRQSRECQMITETETSPADMPAPPVWQELSDPTLEDVLWMTHKLMHNKGMAGFPCGETDFGINWDIKANCADGQHAAWDQTNPFQSPASTTQDHSTMLYDAYKNGILDLSDLYGPAESSTQAPAMTPRSQEAICIEEHSDLAMTICPGDDDE